MAVDFIDIIREVRGSSPLETINDYIGDSSNADNPVTQEEGMFQRIKDKYQRIVDTYDDAEAIKEKMWGSDPVDGSPGTVLADIKAMEAQVGSDEESALASKDASAISEDNAKTSETNVKISEDNAKISEDNAKTSETNAKTSENNAKTSETNSKANENNAKTSETNSKTSETNSKTSETNSKISEDNAKVSENNAKTSENNSKTSENNAKTSENNAKTSENNAKTSEDNSKASETNSKTSEDNAKTSETNSKTSETNLKTSENNSKTSEANAKTSENNSKISEDNSKTSENNSKTSENNSKTSEDNSKTSEDNSKTSENNAKVSENNSKTSEDSAKTSENNSKISEDNAKTSENNAKTSETNAKASEDNAKISETNSKTSENNALASENNAATSENNALASENNAATSATDALASENNAATSATDAQVAKLDWKGEWASGAYDFRDAVGRSGSSYVANKDTYEEPSQIASDWDILSLKGSDGSGSGDMSKQTYDSNDNGVVDNSEKVNGLTVETAVPAGAKFTDTVYDDTTMQDEVDANTAKFTNVDTNLSLGTHSGTMLVIESSDGDNVTLPESATAKAGLLSGNDKDKIDAISGSNTGDEAEATATTGGVLTDNMAIKLDGIEPLAKDDQTAAEVNLDGYSKPSTGGSIGASDSTQVAIGKLEKGIDNAVAGNGDINVQADWSITDSGSDAYIVHKPALAPSDADNTANNETSHTDVLVDNDVGVNVQGYNAETTIQGNAFNGNSQLVKTESDGKLPAIDGSQLTNISSTNIGLENVDNTSDEDKPISTAQRSEFTRLEQQAVAMALVLG